MSAREWADTLYYFHASPRTDLNLKALKAKGVVGGCINFLSVDRGQHRLYEKPGFPKECDVPTSCISAAW